MTRSKKRATEKADSTEVLVLSGEVTVGDLGELQRRALHSLDTNRPLHVDCRAISYLDAAGHQFLCALRREGVERGIVVSVSPPAPSVLADSERLGMDRVFTDNPETIDGASA